MIHFKTSAILDHCDLGKLLSTLFKNSLQGQVPVPLPSPLMPSNCKHCWRQTEESRQLCNNLEANFYLTRTIILVSLHSACSQHEALVKWTSYVCCRNILEECEYCCDYPVCGSRHLLISIKGLVPIRQTYTARIYMSTLRRMFPHHIVSRFTDVN